MVACCDHATFKVLVIPPGDDPCDDSTPFRSWIKKAETSNTEDLAVLTLCQHNNIIALCQVHCNLMLRGRTRIYLADKSSASTGHV